MQCHTQLHMEGGWEMPLGIYDGDVYHRIVPCDNSPKVVNFKMTKISQYFTEVRVFLSLDVCFHKKQLCKQTVCTVSTISQCIYSAQFY